MTTNNEATLPNYVNPGNIQFVEDYSTSFLFYQINYRFKKGSDYTPSQLLTFEETYSFMYSDQSTGMPTSMHYRLNIDGLSKEVPDTEKPAEGSENPASPFNLLLGMSFSFSEPLDSSNRSLVQQCTNEVITRARIETANALYSFGGQELRQNYIDIRNAVGSSLE